MSRVRRTSAGKLRNRVQILRPKQIENDFGGFTKTYKKLVRVWAEIKHLNTGGFSGFMPVRNVDISTVESYEVKVRYGSIINRRVRAFADGYGFDYPSFASQGMGREYDLAFSEAFDSIVDLNPIKSDDFVFLERGSQQRGKLLKINRVIVDDVFKEWVVLKCYMDDERGTGYNEYLS